MHGWMDGWMNGRSDGRTHGRTQSPEKSRLHGCEPEEAFLNLCQF